MIYVDESCNLVKIIIKIHSPIVFKKILSTFLNENLFVLQYVFFPEIIRFLISTTCPLDFLIKEKLGFRYCWTKCQLRISVIVLFSLSNIRTDFIPLAFSRNSDS